MPAPLAATLSRTTQCRIVGAQPSAEDAGAHALTLRGEQRLGRHVVRRRASGEVEAVADGEPVEDGVVGADHDVQRALFPARADGAAQHRLVRSSSRAAPRRLVAAKAADTGRPRSAGGRRRRGRRRPKACRCRAPPTPAGAPPPPRATPRPRRALRARRRNAVGHERPSHGPAALAASTRTTWSDHPHRPSHPHPSRIGVGEPGLETDRVLGAVEALAAQHAFFAIDDPRLLRRLVEPDDVHGAVSDADAAPVAESFVDGLDRHRHSSPAEPASPDAAASPSPGSRIGYRSS